jgi:hypothetical protein
MGSDVFKDGKMNHLINLMANHRHLHLNIMCLTQRYNQIPKTVRILFNVYIFFDVTSKLELKIIYDEVACQFYETFDIFYNIFRNLMQKMHDFILFDKMPKNDNKSLNVRHNFNKLLKIN